MVPIPTSRSDDTQYTTFHVVGSSMACLLQPQTPGMPHGLFPEALILLDDFRGLISSGDSTPLGQVHIPRTPSPHLIVPSLSTPFQPLHRNHRVGIPVRQATMPTLLVQNLRNQTSNLDFDTSPPVNENNNLSHIDSERVKHVVSPPKLTPPKTNQHTTHKTHTTTNTTSTHINKHKSTNQQINHQKLMLQNAKDVNGFPANHEPSSQRRIWQWSKVPTSTRKSLAPQLCSSSGLRGGWWGMAWRSGRVPLGQDALPPNMEALRRPL